MRPLRSLARRRPRAAPTAPLAHPAASNPLPLLGSQALRQFGGALRSVGVAPASLRPMVGGAGTKVKGQRSRRNVSLCDGLFLTGGAAGLRGSTPRLCFRPRRALLATAREPFAPPPCARQCHRQGTNHNLNTYASRYLGVSRFPPGARPPAGMEADLRACLGPDRSGWWAPGFGRTVRGPAPAPPSHRVQMTAVVGAGGRARTAHFPPPAPAHQPRGHPQDDPRWCHCGVGRHDHRFGVTAE
jgi:hypothetical protein